MNRRKFIRMLSYGLTGATVLPNLARAAEPEDKRRLQFVFAQIKYRGGDWNPHPLSVTPLIEELMARTSVEAAAAKHEVTLTDRDLFNYPFLYLAGRLHRKDILILCRGQRKRIRRRGCESAKFWLRIAFRGRRSKWQTLAKCMWILVRG